MSALDQYAIGITARPLAGEAWGSETVKTPQEWGMTSASITLALGGEETFSASVPVAALAAQLWPRFARVRVYRQADLTTPVWQGIAVRPTFSASAGEEVHSVSAVSPSYYFQALPYTQDWRIPVSIETPEGLAVQRGLTWVLIGGGAQSIAAIITDAVTKVQLAGFPVAHDVSGIPSWQAPEDRVTDVDCWEVIRRANGWLPWLLPRWEHAGVSGDSDKKPVLTWGSILRTGNAFALPASTWTQHFISLAECDDWQGSISDDKLVRSLAIHYIRKNRVRIDGNAFIVPSYSEDIARAENGGIITRESTVELRGAEWDGESYVGGEPEPAGGQAAHLLAPFADPYFALSFTKTGEDCDWDFRPGNGVNVTDGPDGFATAAAVIQTVTHRLHSGTTEVQAGPPSQMGAGTPRDIARPNKIRRVPGDAGMQTYGFEPAKDDPETTVGTGHDFIVEKEGLRYFANIPVNGALRLVP